MNEEQIKAFTLVIEAVEDYINYKHSGDPWEEDARVMQEMFIDSFRPKCENENVIEICRKAIEAAQQSVHPTLGTRRNN